MRQQLTLLLAVVLAISAIAPIAGTGAAADTGTQESQAECEYPIELTDATGETITLEEPPESVVALQASDAQTVFEIGADERLVGMPHSDATSGLDRAGTESVGDGWNVDHERVIELDPDIVLAANTTRKPDLQTLRDAGLTVYHFDEAESLDDVRDNVLRTGELTGECDGATETAEWMDEQLEIVETAVDEADRPLAYYSMDANGYTAGPGTFIHEALTTAGVENLAEGEGYHMEDPETVVAEDPDWIIYPEGSEDDDEPIPQTLEATPAYQNGNLVAVDGNQISQPAPQVVHAVVDIVETVHPDAYEEASAELDVDNETDENDSAGDDSDGDESDGNEDTVPGFGVPAAVAAALAAVGLLARRR